MSENNGTTTTEAKESALEKLHKAWVAGGKKKPDAKTATALVSAWEKAHEKKLKAEAAYNAAQKEEQDAAIAIVKARGKGRFITPDGAQLTPMSKGETVFLRVDGGTELESFG